MSDATERHGLAMREAASDMRARHGDGHPRQAFWSALASWLEGVWYRSEEDPEMDNPPNWMDWNAAVDIAKAYQAAS